MKSPNSLSSKKQIGEPFRRWLLDVCESVGLAARFLFPELALAIDDGAGVSVICQFAGSPLPSRDVENPLGNFPSSAFLKSRRSSSDFNSIEIIVTERKMANNRNMVQLRLPKEKRAASAARLN